MLGWAQTAALQTLVDDFSPPASVSDRWTYRLRAELPTLSGLVVPLPAAVAELRRLLDRLEMPLEQRRSFADRIVAFLEGYRAWWAEEPRRGNLSDDEVKAQMLQGFVTLCQSASFLARGREQR